MDDEREDKELPTNCEDEHVSDGFDQPDEQAGRVIVGPIEKFVDGDWITGGLPGDPKRRLVAVGTDALLQHWKEQRVTEVVTEKPLPDLQLLNETIPRKEWELDMNGNPRPPWQRAHILYLLDLDTADRSTFISATIGGAIAVSRLKDKVAWMRRMRGSNVVPQIELTWAPFPTRFGMRKRPNFKVLGWVNLSSGDALPAPAPKQLPPVSPKQVEEPGTEQALNDAIPF